MFTLFSFHFFVFSSFVETSNEEGIKELFIYALFSPFIIFVWTKLRIFTSICVTPCSKQTQPNNFEAMKILKNAPPSNILKTKSQKVKFYVYALIMELIAVDLKNEDWKIFLFPR